MELPFALDEERRGPPARAVDVPLVLPGDRGSSHSRRVIKRLGVLVVLVAAGAVGWVVLNQSNVEVASGVGDAPGTFSSAAQTTDGPVDPEFRDAAASFETTAAGYGERSRDYELGRLDCSGLRNGYRRVDEAFVSLSALYGSVARNESTDALYGIAKADMERVETHFSTSGCPR